jgi:hypothetical protein
MRTSGVAGVTEGQAVTLDGWIFEPIRSSMAI